MTDIATAAQAIEPEQLFFSLVLYVSAMYWIKCLMVNGRSTVYKILNIPF